jgi:hypothetical protein
MFHTHPFLTALRKILIVPLMAGSITSVSTVRVSNAKILNASRSKNLIYTMRILIIWVQINGRCSVHDCVHALHGFVECTVLTIETSLFSGRRNPTTDTHRHDILDNNKLKFLPKRLEQLAEMASLGRRTHHTANGIILAEKCTYHKWQPMYLFAPVTRTLSPLATTGMIRGFLTSDDATNLRHVTSITAIGN